MLVNGWKQLAELVGRTDLVQDVLVVGPVDIAASADGIASVTANGTAINSPDGELYVLAAFATGTDPAVATEQFLGQSNLVSPDYYDAKVTISLEAGGMRLSDKPIHIASQFGGHYRLPSTGGFTIGEARSVEIVPHTLPVPLIVSPGQSVRVDLESRFTTAQRVWFTFHGIKRLLSTAPLPVDFLLGPQLVRTLGKYGDGYRLEPMYYALNFDETTDRAAFETEQRTFTVSGGDFVCTQLSGTILDPDFGRFYPTAEDFIPSEFVRLSLNNGAVRLDGRPFPFASVFGSGKYPNYLPAPLMLPVESSLTAIIQANDNSNTGNDPLRMFMGFGGARIVPREVIS